MTDEKPMWSDKPKLSKLEIVAFHIWWSLNTLRKTPDEGEMKKVITDLEEAQKILKSEIGECWREKAENVEPRVRRK